MVVKHSSIRRSHSYLHLSASICGSIALAKLGEDLPRIDFQVLTQLLVIAERRQDEVVHPGIGEALEALNTLLRGAQHTVAVDEILKWLMITL